MRRDRKEKVIWGLNKGLCYDHAAWMVAIASRDALGHVITNIAVQLYSDFPARPFPARPFRAQLLLPQREHLERPAVASLHAVMTRAWLRYQQALAS